MSLRPVTGLERLRALAKVTQHGEGSAGTSWVFWSLFLTFCFLASLHSLSSLPPSSFFSSSPWLVVPFSFLTSLHCVCGTEAVFVESRTGVRSQLSPACGAWVANLDY